MLVSGTTSTCAVRRLRRIGETCPWTLIIAAIAIFWVAAQLRIVVLPVGLAVVLATFLWPATSRLRSVGLPRGAAAAVVLGVALMALTVLLALLAPQTIDEFGELDVGISGGLKKIEDWLVNGTLGLSSDQVDDVADRIREQAEASAGTLAGGALSGALLLIEVIAAALILLWSSSSFSKTATASGSGSAASFHLNITTPLRRSVRGAGPHSARSSADKNS